MTSTFFRAVPPAPAPQQTTLKPAMPERGARSVVVGPRAGKPEAIAPRAHGVAPAAPVDLAPDGVLLRIGKGWFDRRGFWCVKSGDLAKVSRGAPRAITALMDDDQKRVVRNAQLNARRKGLR